MHPFKVQIIFRYDDERGLYFDKTQNHDGVIFNIMYCVNTINSVQYNSVVIRVDKEYTGSFNNIFLQHINFLFSFFFFAFPKSVMALIHY